MSADLAIRPDVLPGIRIADVIVGERARKDYGDLTALMESIRDVGLLQPIGLTPGSHLLFGGRRLEACRRLAWESIPFVRPSTRDDALSLLKAERDENTCRKDMTPEELVNLGMRLEELERPKAEARMSEGGRRGAESRWADGVGPDGPTPSETPETNRTAQVVGDALGLSRNTYKRMKAVVTTARDDTAEPEIQQTAQAALADLNAGKTTPTGAYNRVRKARQAKPEGGSNLAMPRPAKSTRPKVLRNTHRISSRRVIAATVETYLNNAIPTDLLAEIDLSELEAHDLREWISSLSESARALRSLRTTLEKELSQRG